MKLIWMLSLLLLGQMVTFGLLQAQQKINIEVVSAHTSVVMRVDSINIVGTPGKSVTRCSGISGIYSREYGYDCNTTFFPEVPGHTKQILDYTFMFDLNVIMPDGSRLTLHCSTISDKHCEGFPSYSENTTVNCESYNLAGSYYKDCYANGTDFKGIGMYEAQVHGDKITIYGDKWKHEYKKAEVWESTAPNTEPDDPISQTNLGVKYDQGSGVPIDHVKAAMLYRQAAEHGNADAQYFLGYDYFIGQGVPQDFNEAIIWYRKAAEQGHAAAQLNLGSLYYAGQGVNQDYVQAAKWIQKAAEQNDGTAACSLGLLYEFGKGVPIDYSEAYFWLDIGTAQVKGADLVTCQKNRDDVSSKLSKDELVRVQERAASWFIDHQSQH